MFAEVYCGDPAQSISKMGGQIINYISPPHPFNTTFQFACGPGQRLLGSEFRTCIGNGQWSGVATVCDKTGDELFIYEELDKLYAYFHPYLLQVLKYSLFVIMLKKKDLK